MKKYNTKFGVDYSMCDHTQIVHSEGYKFIPDNGWLVFLAVFIGGYVIVGLVIYFLLK